MECDNVISVDEALTLVQDRLKNERGTLSRLAKEKNLNVWKYSCRLKSLFKSVSDSNKEFKELFFSLFRSNIEPEFRIIDDSPSADCLKKEYLVEGEQTEIVVDPRASKIFRDYIDEVRKKKRSAFLTHPHLYNILKGSYSKHRKKAFSILVRTLEGFRRELKMEIHTFYRLAAEFVVKPDGKIYNFRWLLNVDGSSYNDFLLRIERAIGPISTQVGRDNQEIYSFLEELGETQIVSTRIERDSKDWYLVGAIRDICEVKHWDSETLKEKIITRHPRKRARKLSLEEIFEELIDGKHDNLEGGTPYTKVGPKALDDLTEDGRAWLKELQEAEKAINGQS